MDCVGPPLHTIQPATTLFQGFAPGAAWSLPPCATPHVALSPWPIFSNVVLLVVEVHCKGHTMAHGYQGYPNYPYGPIHPGVCEATHFGLSLVVGCGTQRDIAPGATWAG